MDRAAEINRQVVVIMCAPVTPILRPRRPVVAAPIAGRNRRVRYIYLVLLREIDPRSR